MHKAFCLALAFLLSALQHIYSIDKLILINLILLMLSSNNFFIQFKFK